MTRQKFLGHFPEMKIEQARGRASELNSAVAKDENPFEVSVAQEEPTLAELFEYYLEHHMRAKRKTADECERNFDRWFRSGERAIASKRASGISHQDAEKLHEKLAESRGRYAANRAIQLAKAVYFYAIKKKKFAQDNPFAGITLFHETPRNRFLSDEEAVRVLSELKNEPSEDLRDFILLDMLTGVRKANLYAMEWQQLNFELGRWTVPDTKTNCEQVIALGTVELRTLEQRKLRQAEAGTSSSFVFPGCGKSGHLKDLKRSWTSFRKRAGIEDVTIHDLRRSLASAMANRNINVALIKSTLNHKDLKTTLNAYAHAGKQAELEAREKAVNPWLVQAGLLDEG